MREEVSFPCVADREAMRELRSSVRTQLESWQITDLTANRIVLVVDEIASNSIDHSADYRVQEPHFELALDGAFLEFSFIDPDAPEALVGELERRFAELTEPPALDDERGRGLFLIRQSLENVTFTWSRTVGMTLAGRVPKTK